MTGWSTLTRANPGGGGETCAETGISIFFGKVLHFNDVIRYIIS